MLVKGISDLATHLRKAPQHPLVNARHIFILDTVGGGVKVVEVSEDVAEGVSDLARRIRHLAHDVAANAHVSRVVHRGNPKAQDIGTKGRLLLLVLAALNNEPGVNDVAERLGHLEPLLVEHEPVRKHSLVGCNAVGSNRREQRRLEPPAMLVRALQIHVGRVRECLTPPPLFGDAIPRGARIKPHIHRVLTSLPQMGLVLVRRRQQILDGKFPPTIGAALGHNITDIVDTLLREQRLAGLLVVKDRNGHTPGTLPGDAPIRAPRNHRCDPVLASRRHPRNGINSLEARFAEVFDRGKPLVCGAEDGGLFGAPIIGVLVRIGLDFEERSCLIHHFDTRRVAVAEHVLAH
mmetsp:Transcript_12092/g.17482  ORF Transcript_12092/g.17482 Transcript_12092/m.17482 type:complete len:349 (-) Transcript_12092:1650-2696(-)